MGGRGGSGPSLGTGSNESGPAAEFRQWASSRQLIDVDAVSGGNYLVTLPDVGAHARREGGRYVLRNATDDKILFSNKTAKGLWEEVSKHYGGKVKVTISEGGRGAGGIYGDEYGRKSSPAAKIYGAR